MQYWAVSAVPTPLNYTYKTFDTSFLNSLDIAVVTALNYHYKYNEKNFLPAILQYFLVSILELKL